ncbi:monovalent cation:H+ antiporter, CPA1 family [Pseudoxanthobacter soli DSM 19599]|uniref:Monovalent cation:H+ antiporter, CPA1 family n=1 Tax=Pseudoxanthobacter soli DSM 19599 TaxID=1123029 RepID=A0A1M7ZQX2_9HYPH|nr:sodium:proton antiporter [Pseudoxanthobacter soli]SHO67308.1 monovalent cation:H+ antiporter, CPA1 family [Pseudoxanthobacter soli DSM 19599]
MLSLFQLLAGLLTVTATFAWLNHRVLRLPDSIGLLVMGLGASLTLIAIEIVFPDTHLYATLATGLQQIDFYEAVMHGMLAFLLFAGALHVDFGRLRRRAPVVGAFATLGVALSSLIIAAGLWLGTEALGMPIGFAWSLVFGALIAPTDPVAVLSTLRSVNVPEKLETDMTGEALFNDGVAVVLFTITLQMAAGSEGASRFAHIAQMLVLEAGGGALLGLATGYVAYRAMRAIDDYSIEVMISLALVTATYALADAFHMSGPIAVVVAGVLIGNRGVACAMSDRTRRYIFGFWTLVDDILNAVLFLLIGLEVLVLNFNPAMAWVGLIAVPLVLVGRFISVAVSVSLLARWQSFAKGTLAVLTWGGVRGGISVALALSLTGTPARSPLLAATYAVVLFTILVQGLTLGWVVRKTAVVQEGGPRGGPSDG